MKRTHHDHAVERRTALRLLAGAGAALGACPISARAQRANRVRIASSTTDPYMVPYYATDLGFFTRAGGARYDRVERHSIGGPE